VSTVRIVVLACVGLLVFTGAAFGLSEALHRQERDRSVVASPVKRIVVHADAGNVQIRAGLTSSVVIARHDTWLLDRPKVSEVYADAGQQLTIRTSCGGLRSILRCRTDLMIDAPPDIDVEVRTDSGNVDLRGLRGRADIHTNSGDISTQRLEPITVKAWTSAGNVSLDLFGSPTRTDARSDAGDVRVVVPYGPYRVDATTDAGDVKVEGLIRDDLAPQAIEALTDAGNITVRAR
jgi:hypothetical protein